MQWQMILFIRQLSKRAKNSSKTKLLTFKQIRSNKYTQLIPLLLSLLNKTIHLQFYIQKQIATITDCLRPMSAQIRYQTSVNPRITISANSKTSIDSQSTLIQNMRTKRNTSSIKSLMGISNSKRKIYKQNLPNQKKFFAVNTTCQDDLENTDYIQKLRLRKQQEQNQAKKKQQFLKSIQLQKNSYETSKSKFMQSISRKKFIYSHQGQIIEIAGLSQKSHLKKISAISKSRVEVKSKGMINLKKIEQDLKQNIYIEYRGRQIYQSQPETGKPTRSDQIQDFKHKILSAKQAKKQGQNQISKTGLITKDKLKSEQAHREKDEKNSIQNQKGPTNNKIQKILFYPSSNSVYRVLIKKWQDS